MGDIASDGERSRTLTTTPGEYGAQPQPLPHGAILLPQFDGNATNSTASDSVGNRLRNRGCSPTNIEIAAVLSSSGEESVRVNSRAGVARSSRAMNSTGSGTVTASSFERLASTRRTQLHAISRRTCMDSLDATRTNRLGSCEFVLIDEARKRRPECSSMMISSSLHAMSGSITSEQTINVAMRNHNMDGRDLSVRRSLCSGNRPWKSSGFCGAEIPVTTMLSPQGTAPANSMPPYCCKVLGTLRRRTAALPRKVLTVRDEIPEAGRFVWALRLVRSRLAGSRRSLETQRLTSIQTDRMMPPLDASSKIDRGNMCQPVRYGDMVAVASG